MKSFDKGEKQGHVTSIRMCDNLDDFNKLEADLRENKHLFAAMVCVRVQGYYCVINNLITIIILVILIYICQALLSRYTNIGYSLQVYLQITYYLPYYPIRYYRVLGTIVRTYRTSCHTSCSVVYVACVTDGAGGDTPCDRWGWR